MEIRIEINEELKSRLRKAQSAEEAFALLKEKGADAPLAERIWNEIRAGREDKQLSLDELAAVSGGQDLDYYNHGCAATVEPGSNCWGVDGGCSHIHNTYKHMPNAYCERCGYPCYVEESYDAANKHHVKMTDCFNCHTTNYLGWWE